MNSYLNIHKHTYSMYEEECLHNFKVLPQEVLIHYKEEKSN